MGNRFYHVLEIGGDPGENRDRLMALVNDDGLNTEFLEAEVYPHLHISCCEAPGDWLDDLKQRIREMQLPYNHYVSGNEECNSELLCYRPEDGDETLYTLITHDVPVVTIDELKCSREMGENLRHVIAKYDPPDLPNFVSPEHPYEPQPIICDFCGCHCENEETAVHTGWEPGYYDGDIEIPEHVCPDCQTEHLIESNGVLIKRPETDEGIELEQLKIMLNEIVPRGFDRVMSQMTEEELSEHMTHQMDYIERCATLDTIGAILLVFADNQLTQYASSIDPASVPAALREMADRLERRDTVTR